MKGFIYKITDNTNDNVYYGSTIEKVSSRLAKHRYKYKLYKNGLSHFVTSYLILENNNYKYECIEELEIETIEEMLLREKWYIQNNKCVNSVSPIETKEEYKERHRIADKKYYNENKEVFAEKAKIYREENKELISEQKRLNWKQNVNSEYRIKLREKNAEKIICEICGVYYTFGNRGRHFKSKKHLG